MTYAEERREATELAMKLLVNGGDKNDLYSVFLQLATVLLTCNSEILYTELKKMRDG